jgi:hypothetical protein
VSCFDEAAPGGEGILWGILGVIGDPPSYAAQKVRIESGRLGEPRKVTSPIDIGRVSSESNDSVDGPAEKIDP